MENIWRKARLVVGSHMTEIPQSIMYLSVILGEPMRIEHLLWYHEMIWKSKWLTMKKAYFTAPTMKNAIPSMILNMKKM